MKTCVTCKHFIPEQGGIVPHCAISSRVDLVTGEDKTRSCYIERNYGKCGEHAVLWEPMQAKEAA